VKTKETMNAKPGGDDWCFGHKIPRHGAKWLHTSAKGAWTSRCNIIVQTRGYFGPEGLTLTCVNYVAEARNLVLFT
jgi:hypothetical protein